MRGGEGRAESIATSIANGQVVANQIAVVPPGGESTSRTVNADLDGGIEKNLDAALIMGKLHKGVTYDVKSGVVTLRAKWLLSPSGHRLSKWLQAFPTCSKS